MSEKERIAPDAHPEGFYRDLAISLFASDYLVRLGVAGVIVTALVPYLGRTDWLDIVVNCVLAIGAVVVLRRRRYSLTLADRLLVSALHLLGFGMIAAFVIGWRRPLQIPQDWTSLLPLILCWLGPTCLIVAGAMSYFVKRRYIRTILDQSGINDPMTTTTDSTAITDNATHDRIRETAPQDARKL